MASERQIEMTWRCGSCRAQNLGRHMVCQTCGSPKDETEEYEMPADTAAAATVTDPRLLELAKAGANWRCRYCGSDQRTLEGRCGQCGSDQREGRSTAALSPAPAAMPVPAPPRRSPGLLGGVVLLVGGLAFLLVVCGLVLRDRSVGGERRLTPSVAAALRLPFQDQKGTVSAVRWKQEITVERWQVLPGEGFEEARPGDAFDVRPAGRRFHHKERVVAGYDTQTYTETEPDGTRSETYTDQEACGQDCTPRPQSCQEKCTPNKNGFATCRTECSGGGQDCRTKYCTVTKTRQVPQTKTVTKTRQVPRYQDVDRDAPWFAWKVWGWKPARTLATSGTSPRTFWPDESEVKLGKGLAAGEKERERRHGSYTLEFESGGARRAIDVPSAEALAIHPPGSRVSVRVWQSGRADLL